MPSRLRAIWADILCCLLLQASLVAGGELVHRWTAASAEPPCCAPLPAL